MKEKKSYIVGWLLSVLFGPLGAMYGCWWSGLGLFALTVIFGAPLAALIFDGEALQGIIIIWLISTTLAILDVTLNIFQNNRKVDKINEQILAKEAREERSRKELLEAIRTLHNSGTANSTLDPSITGPLNITDESSYIKCKGCSKNYDAWCEFCPNCGTAKLKPTNKETHASTKKHTSSLDIKNLQYPKNSVAISLAVVFLVAGVFYYKKSIQPIKESEPYQASNIRIDIPSENHTPIPRSAPGDKGKYYLLSMEAKDGLVLSLHKRVGVEYIGYTATETNCKDNLIRELGYSELSPDAIQINQSAGWYPLVYGSSKDDLAKFVCKKANLEISVSNPTGEAQTKIDKPATNPEEAKWEECAEKASSKAQENGKCGSAGCLDNHGVSVEFKECGLPPGYKKIQADLIYENGHMRQDFVHVKFEENAPISVIDNEEVDFYFTGETEPRARSGKPARQMTHKSYTIWVSMDGKEIIFE